MTNPIHRMGINVICVKLNTGVPREVILAEECRTGESRDGCLLLSLSAGSIKLVRI